MEKASEKKMKNYKELYEGEKEQHEEVLQRYQEDNADEMAIIKLHKRVARRIGRFYSLKHYPNQMNLNIYQNPLITQVSKNRSLKKHQAIKKRPLQRQEKVPKSPAFVDTDSDDTNNEQEPTIKKSNDYKGPLLLGFKEEILFFFFFDL